MPRSPLAYLVEAAALDQAEVTCLSDADARARRREREAERRAELDRDYLARFAGRVRELYPGAPPEQARDQVAPRVREVLRSWRAG